MLDEAEKLCKSIPKTVYCSFNNHYSKAFRNTSKIYYLLGSMCYEQYFDNIIKLTLQFEYCELHSKFLYVETRRSFLTSYNLIDLSK